MSKSPKKMPRKDCNLPEAENGTLSTVTLPMETTDVQLMATMEKKIGAYRIKISPKKFEYYDLSFGWTPLANFSCVIDRQITMHEVGGAMTTEYEISGEGPYGPLHTIRVKAEEFSKTRKWISASWGKKAPICPSSQTRDEILRCAIESMPGTQFSNVYRELGWREIDGQWVYLHADGGISGEGKRRELVEPGDRLAPAVLNVKYPSVSPIKIIETLLACAENHIIWPLLAAAFRAPLGRWQKQCDSLFLLGRSGSMKTTLAMLFQQFYGAGFSRGRSDARPPATFNDTAKSILYRTHAAGEMLVVVDDYAPACSEQRSAQQRAAAEELFRAAGNRSPRGRLSADSKPISDLYPRCLILATGEDCNFTESIAARLFVLEVSRGAVKPAALTAAQELGSSGELAGMMADYIHWLAERGEPVGSAERFECGGAPRAAEMAGNLAWGIENLLAYLDGKAAPHVIAAMRNDAMESLSKAAAKAARDTVAVDPAEQFLELLKQAVAMKRAKIATIGGDSDEDNVPVIGYCDRQTTKIWLLPAAALSAAKKLATESGKPFTISERGTGKRLLEAGHVATTDTTRGTVTVRKTLGQGIMSVWELHANTLLDVELKPDPDADIPF